MDCKHETTVDEIQNREHPVIQLDIVFATAGNAALLLLDTWTRFCFATSTKRKSAKTVAESLGEFLGMLGLVISARWKSLLTMNF